MGERVLIQFENDYGELSPVVYLHWGGGCVADLLIRLRERMADRPGDITYVYAQTIGLVWDKDYNTGVGGFNQPTRLTEEDSHGDAGCYVVDCHKWVVECMGGYGFAHDSDDYEDFRSGRFQVGADSISRFEAVQS